MATQNSNGSIPLLAVVGPTASGKSELAVRLALRFGGEVVGADSMQIYKGMDIASAKPSPEQMRGVPHHMTDFLPPEESFSVARYVKMAGDRIREIRSRGRLPILAGGTGLYVTSLIDNIKFSPVPTDENMRGELYRRAETGGAESLREELMKIDPETAAALGPGNLGRVIRALEVFYASGITMAEHKRRSRLEPSPYEALMIGLDFKDRSGLYARIDARVDGMLAAGLPDEAREAALYRQNHKTAAQAIGHKELLPYLEGKCSLAEAVEGLKRETRRYAKRQLTWFRRDPRVNWLYIDELGPDGAEAAACEMTAKKLIKI